MKTDKEVKEKISYLINSIKGYTVYKVANAFKLNTHHLFMKWITYLSRKQVAWLIVF